MEVKPLVDCVFKHLFGSEKNKNLILNLINAIMEAGKEEKIVEIELLDPYNLKTTVLGKLSIVDIKARNEKGEWFIIEVQIKMHTTYPKRLLYYWAVNYQKQITEGEKYKQLKKTKIISISEENLAIEVPEYFNVYKVQNVKYGNIFCEDLAIYTIELEKFINTTKNLASKIDKWSYFLKNGGYMKEDTIPSEIATEEIKNAVKELSLFTEDEIARNIYETRVKVMMDELSMIEDAKDEGEKIGIVKGKEIGIIEGEKTGEIKGKIETVLEFKFVDIKCMEQIKLISDIDKLNQILIIAKEAKDIDTFKNNIKNYLI